MATNADILNFNKADTVVADLASGGLLEPTHRNQFLQAVLDAPTLLRQVRQEIMPSPKHTIDKLGFGSRVLQPGVEYTGLTAGLRSAPTFSKVELSAVKVMAHVKLSYETIWNNIEGGNINYNGGLGGSGAASGGLIDTIIKMLGDRVAVDLEEMAIVSDSANGALPALHQLTDGFLKLAVAAHPVDNLNAGANVDMFKNGLAALPAKYQRDLGRLRHFVNPSDELNYRSFLSNRETGQGDAVINSFNPVYGLGVALDRTALMPVGSGLLTDPRNLIFGIQRDITMEAQKDIFNQAWDVVVHASIDFAIEETDATVEYSNI